MGGADVHLLWKKWKKQDLWDKYLKAVCSGQLLSEYFQADLLDMGIFTWSNYLLKDIDMKILGNIIGHFHNGWNYNLKK